MNPSLESLAVRVNTNVPGAQARAQAPEVGDGSVSIEAAHLKEVCQYLKAQENFRVLQVISAVDFPQREVIELNYMLANFQDGPDDGEFILKTQVPRGAPSIDSVASIWKAADWQEREAYDMLGVKFEGHPDPRRILCPDDWEGFPLRKDYKVQKEYQGMEVDPPEKINTEDHLWGEQLAQKEENPDRIVKSWT